MGKPTTILSTPPESIYIDDFITLLWDWCLFLKAKDIIPNSSFIKTTESKYIWLCWKDFRKAMKELWLEEACRLFSEQSSRLIDNIKRYDEIEKEIENVYDV